MVIVSCCGLAQPGFPATQQPGQLAAPSLRVRKYPTPFFQSPSSPPPKRQGPVTFPGWSCGNIEMEVPPRDTQPSLVDPAWDSNLPDSTEHQTSAQSLTHQGGDGPLPSPVHSRQASTHLSPQPPALTPLQRSGCVCADEHEGRLSVEVSWSGARVYSTPPPALRAWVSYSASLLLSLASVKLGQRQ